MEINIFSHFIGIKLTLKLVNLKMGNMCRLATHPDRQKEKEWKDYEQ